ncbi:putative DNA binding domain-containing protein [Patescibacteria group bacterium]|nr:putative DNA binding domain-containing protein [Patescibacteria group bacterium]
MLNLNDDLPVWQQPESRRLEFKENFPSGNQIAKTVIAFANGAGGRIVFGIRDNPREISGIPDEGIFPLEERIAQHIADQCAPLIIPDIYIQACEGRNLLVVEVFSGFQKPYYLKSKGKSGGIYVRIGSANKLASEDVREELERQRRKISFDAVPVFNLSFAEVDLTQFQNDYRKATGRILENDQLKNLGLLFQDRDQWFPTQAAVLLSESPVRKQLFPYAKIECARFKGTDTSVFLDQMSIECPIYAAVEPCLAFIKKNIALSSQIAEVYRKDQWEYPLEAIREAISNAIIHRDYAILGSDIKVAIFDDMLEITSPGALPDTMPIEKLGTGRSEIRNRVLAPIFKDLKLIEAWGTGIQKMQKALENRQEIELILSETGRAFQVQFKKKPNPAHIADRTTVFKTVQVPYKMRTSTVQDAYKLKVLDFCREQRSMQEMMTYMNLKHRASFLINYIHPLLQDQLISLTVPDKPKSPRQKYIVTEKGQGELKLE